MRGPRIGNAERTHVLGLLDGAHTAGLLPVEQYDTRVAQVGTATYASELADQVADLPPPYTLAQPPPATAGNAAGNVALILGIASVPLSICAVGGVLGVLAVLASRGAARGRVTPALIGRVFGILGIALSIAAVAAMIYARSHAA
jgi:hypothetical protein